MTQKDYIVLAAALSSALECDVPDNADARLLFAKIYSSICEELLLDNPKFNEARFRRAVFVDL